MLYLINNMSELRNSESSFLIKDEKSNLENKEKKIKNTNKERNPGIDLLRIIGMYAIVVHHIIILENVKRYKYQEIRFLNTLCCFHICVFGLISGVVGHNSNKYSNLINLWFNVVFYTFGIYIICKYFHRNYFGNEKAVKFLFPVVFKCHWYFSAYFGMFLFLPIINKGISVLNKLELKIIAFTLICIFTLWDDFFSNKRDPFSLNNGHCPMALLIYYIIGTYLGKYIIINETNILTHLIYLTLYISSSFLSYYFSTFNKNNTKVIHKKQNLIILQFKNIFNLRINSITRYIQGISLTLIFSRIKYNKYICKIVSFIGPLTFSVYLIHCNYFIYKYNFKTFAKYFPRNISPKVLIFYIILNFNKSNQNICYINNNRLSQTFII